MEDTNMKKTIFAEKAPAAVGPYVHAVEAGNMVFTSGSFALPASWDWIRRTELCRKASRHRLIRH